MEFKPHDYQRFAIDYIEHHSIAAIFLDMGLGKTVISLTAIRDLMYDYFAVKKVLIIAPLRVARSTWTSEIKKWDHLKDLTYSVAVGSEPERIRALMAKKDIYIINRENVQWLIEKEPVKWDFDMVVIDELSSFKSHQSKRFKYLMKIRPKISRIVGLTGTPSPNSLLDLWAQFKLLDGGKRLYRFIGNYRDEFFQPDKRSASQIFSYKLKKGADAEIYNRISDITVSMKAEDYLKMPELTENVVRVELDPEDREKYDQLKNDLVVEFGDQVVDAMSAAVLSNKLVQMANGAVYDDKGATIVLHDKKLDALEDLIEASNGKPVLVGYWYKHDIERIRKRFRVREIRTEQDINDWNAGLIPVGAIHPASAGHGLNLQAGGSTFIWFSLTWSLELYQQANARLYRQGQRHGVIIHHIVASGTIDEAVMNALKRKDTTQSALINAVRAEIGR